MTLSHMVGWGLGEGLDLLAGILLFEQAPSAPLLQCLHFLFLLLLHPPIPPPIPLLSSPSRFHGKSLECRNLNSPPGLPLSNCVTLGGPGLHFPGLPGPHSPLPWHQGTGSPAALYRRCPLACSTTSPRGAHPPAGHTDIQVCFYPPGTWG